MLVYFSKMHSGGKDFMLVDQISQRVRLRPEQVRSLAERRAGIGFTQLLALEPPSHPEADFLCRVFNADGSETLPEAAALACIARFAQEKKLVYKEDLYIETSTQIVQLKAPLNLATANLDNSELPVQAVKVFEGQVYI